MSDFRARLDKRKARWSPSSPWQKANFTDVALAEDEAQSHRRQGGGHTIFDIAGSVADLAGKAAGSVNDAFGDDDEEAPEPSVPSEPEISEEKRQETLSRIKERIKERNKANEEGKSVQPPPPRKPYVADLKGKDKNTAKVIRIGEGKRNHLYQDDQGHITFGVGHKAENIEELKSTPFKIIEKGKKSRFATDEEIEKTANQVKSMKKGMEAFRYDPDNNKGMLNLRLDNEDMEKTFQQDMNKHAREFEKNWNMRLKNFPESVRTGLIDVHFNRGGGSDGFKPEVWTELNKALKNKDWTEAATQMHRKETAAGVVIRNKNIQTPIWDEFGYPEGYKR